MEDILKQLYHGELYPDEAIMTSNPNYLKIQDRINGDYEHFKEKMSVEDAKRLEGLKNQTNDISAMEGYENFAYGFKLGVALMLEVFY